FLVGKGSSGRYFNGAIDYLRVAGGSFAEARTTINELYEWEFNGPATRDFTGAAAVGQRDAGAFEWGIVSNRWPRVTMQPQPLLVFENGAASFNVFADAAETYQWRRGGAAIPNATNARYSISAAHGAHVGTYDVVVSNAFGWAVSDMAGLTIVPEPMLGAVAFVLLAAWRLRGWGRRQ
ncbi:immunoglobulin domain-containing protein, partial [bacterium]|nr:immunoglobulin domain-containing protein [bacterium]